jgi:hypothetical protein
MYTPTIVEKPQRISVQQEKDLSVQEMKDFKWHTRHSIK